MLKPTRSATIVLFFLLILIPGQGSLLAAQAPRLEYLATTDFFAQNPGFSGSSPIEVFDDTLLIPLSRQGLAFIDISDPAQPELLFSYINPQGEEGWQAGHVDVVGSRMALYQPIEDTVGVFDISTDPITLLSEVEAPWHLAKVKLLGQYVVILGGIPQEDIEGFFVMDINDPGGPPVATVPAFFNSLTVDPAIISNDGLAFSRESDFMGIQITDFSNPLNPRIVDSLPEWLPLVRYGNHLTVVSGVGEFSTLDITDLDDIRTLETVYLENDFPTISDVEPLDGNHMLVVGQGKLSLISFDSQGLPTVLSEYTSFQENPSRITRKGDVIMVDELTGPPTNMRAVSLFRVSIPEVFNDGFESGNLTAWSSATAFGSERGKR